MSLLSKTKYFFKSPNKTVLLIDNSFLRYFISDKKYYEYVYRTKMGKKLNLENPKTYNEKIQWLKLYDRKPLYSKIVDKYEVRKYIANAIGEDYLIPLLGVWDKFDDIDFDALPQQFVLKCTHDSGGLVICRDKSKLDVDATRRKINKCLKHNYFWYGREWPYKNVKSRIIAEQYMVDESGTELKDYKFFCFDGEPKALFIATDRGSTEATKFDFFDMDFNHLPFKNGHENAVKPISKPQGFDEMIKLSKKLSEEFPHVRVDLYNINGKLYFGELTFYHWGGMTPFEPEEWDEKFGSWIKLSERQ